MSRLPSAIQKIIAITVFLVLLWIAYQIAKFLIGVVLLFGVIYIAYTIFKKNKIID